MTTHRIVLKPDAVARRTKSKVTNGRTLFNGEVDGRTIWARRLRDLLALHLSALGGEEMVSPAEQSIIRRASAITVELELLEERFALAGGASADDLDLYVRASGGLRRLLESIGLKRVPRDITPPTLADIARDIDARAETVEDG